MDAQPSTSSVSSSRENANVVSRNSSSLFSLSSDTLSGNSSSIVSTKPKNLLLPTSVKRLQKELEGLIVDPANGWFAGPKGDNIYEWACTILGPRDSPYEGGLFFLDLQFFSKYPFKPPRFIFRTPIYHCNFTNHGELNLDFLKETYSPTFTIYFMLSKLYSLFCNPEPSNSAVSYIAHQYQHNRSEYDRKAQEYTQRFAT